jgi:Protein of unknown function (DUF2515)
MATRAEWQAKAERSLPSQRKVRQRNAAITATYADLYLRHRRIFKWAGVAAFASHRVGLLLKLYEEVGPEGLLAARRRTVAGVASALQCRQDRATVVADLDLIRKTNNDVYNDIAWAHFAYADGGIDSIRAAVAGRPRDRLLLAGFTDIDRGQRLTRSRSRRAEAEDAIWRGNQMLLKHEQLVIVQRHFDHLDPGMDAFLSLMTWMDFDLEAVLPFPSGWDSWKHGAAMLAQVVERSDFHLDYTSFYACMTSRGLPVLWQTRSLPDIRRFDQRWFWIEQRVLPLWQRVDATDPTLPRKMRQAMRAPLV